MIIQASAFNIPLADQSVQLVVTSPPYFGLRNYADGTENDFGHEKTVSAYVEHTIQCLSEIRRVLKDEGIVFWNIGDCYAGSNKGWSSTGDGDGPANSTKAGLPRKYPKPTKSELPAKNLHLIPQRIAIAAQDDGWIVRGIFIWQKPNCIPESVQDRCTRSYEEILMLVKQKKYYWNQAEAREPAVSTTGKMSPPIGNVKHQAMGKATLEGNRTLLSETRNMRDVWSIPTKPHKEAHVAMFPEELVERCIHCGSQEGDIILDPFAGSGTTGLVARSLNRKFVLLDISTEYVNLMRERLK